MSTGRDRGSASSGWETSVYTAVGVGEHDGDSAVGGGTVHDHSLYGPG